MSNQKKPANQAPEIKEFVSRGTGTNVKRKAARARQAYTKKSMKFTIGELVSNKQLMTLLLYAVVAVAVILISIFACKIPVVAVCFIVLIETMMAACLHNLQIWMHAVVMLAEIICGIIFQKIVFMIIMALLYFVAIVALRIIRQKR